MEEIKFRAWHKEKKTIREVCEVSFAGGYVILEGFGSFGAIEAPIRDVELMQYTGVKDKRGVEIYEGDIVKFVSRLDDSKRIGAARYWAGDAAFLIECEREIFFLFHDALSREVIGNIYENPEILKDTK